MSVKNVCFLKLLCLHSVQQNMLGEEAYDDVNIETDLDEYVLRL